MNIDWSKAPEDATHYCDMTGGFVKVDGDSISLRTRFVHPEKWGSTATLASELMPTLIQRPAADQKDQTRQEIIELAWKKCGISGDSIRQLATLLAAEGYRKFEIVEDDV